MKKYLKLLAVVLTLALVFSVTACGDKEEAAADECWADKYVALIESGEARDFADYDALKAELDKIREECGANYVYALSPDKDGAPSLDGDTTETGSFLITVDGSADPDDWALNYGWEIQFTEAWDGAPAAARSAWDDEDGQCWSAFAPVYGEDGKVVCILGIDYPCGDTIADYPEWNRDDASWNGFEDEITGDVPEAVQAVIDSTTELADKYAKQLSHK